MYKKDERPEISNIPQLKNITARIVASFITTDMAQFIPDDVLMLVERFMIKKYIYHQYPSSSSLNFKRSIFQQQQKNKKKQIHQ